MSAQEIAEIMAAYDRLYAEAEKLDRYCERTDVRCLGGRFPCCTLQPAPGKKFCDLLDPMTGCRGKSLLCKVWFCAAVRMKYPELDEELDRMRKEARALPGIYFFQSRNDYELELSRIKSQEAHRG